MSRLHELWRQPVVYRTAIGLYVFLVLALAGVTFSVNSMDVQGAVYLRGQPDLELERIHGMRGVFHYAPTGETLQPETMDWHLSPSGDDEAAYPLEFVHGPAHKTWPNPTFRLPSDLDEGTYDLHMEASHDEVSTLTAQREVSVRMRPEPAAHLSELVYPVERPRDDETWRRGAVVEVETGFEEEPTVDIDTVLEGLGEGVDDDIDIDVDEVDLGDVALGVSPVDGELMRGLPQTIYLRTFHPDTGHPIPAEIDLDVTDGIVEGEFETSLRTDSQGLASLDVQPATHLRIEAKVTPAPRHVFDPDIDEDDDEVEELATKDFTVRLSVAPTQYSLRPAARVLSGDDEVEAAVRSVLPDGTFMADLYDFEGERLLDTLSLSMSDGESGVRFPTPETDEASRLLRLQTYQSIYGTTHGWDSTYFLLVDDTSPDNLREVAADLYEWIADETESAHHRAIAYDVDFDELSDAETRRLIDAGLQHLPRTFELPPVMLNTRQSDREELDVWRAEVQEDLRLMMALTIFAGIIVVLYFVVVGIRRQSREAAMLRELQLETDDPPPEKIKRSERIERLAVALQGIIVFMTLLAFALGILIMVSYL